MNNFTERSMQCILIGGCVEFTPYNRILKNTKTNKKLKLHVPASLCFERLLSNQGSVVPQDTLILCGWGEKNTAVSSNTYYQCILHLRKNLALVGLDNVIETVPRHGIMFNHNAEIIFNTITEEKEKPTFGNYARESDDENKPAYHLVSTKIPVQEESNDGYFASTAEEKNTGSGKKLALAIIAGVFAVALPLIFMHLHSTDDINDKYIKLASDKCTIFATDNRFSATEIKGLMDKAGLQCLNKETVFFTTSPMQSRLNFIYCTVYDKNQQNCRSVTLIGKIKGAR